MACLNCFVFGCVEQCVLLPDGDGDDDHHPRIPL